MLPGSVLKVKQKDNKRTEEKVMTVIDTVFEL